VVTERFLSYLLSLGVPGPTAATTYLSRPNQSMWHENKLRRRIQKFHGRKLLDGMHSWLLRMPLYINDPRLDHPNVSPVKAALSYSRINSNTSPPSGIIAERLHILNEPGKADQMIILGGARPSDIPWPKPFRPTLTLTSRCP
jgi:hypothetical protein